MEMNSKTITPRFWVILSMIVTAAAFRLFPHWPNFTPIAAIALFGGAYLGRNYLAFLIPLAAMFVSDLILGFHMSMIAVYASFCATVVIGILISRKPRLLNVALASLGSTILFFLVTNFAAWLGSPMYPQTFAGLMESYAAGLVFLNDGNGVSFFMNSLLGDLFYNAVLFGSFALATLKFPVLAKA
jgi:hypothetical protein